MKLKSAKQFANGMLYALEFADGYPIEVTDTFLPFYTKACINGHTNELHSATLGSRKERWMIGVSCMSGCPVRCKFCATAKLKRTRNLTAGEIVAQIDFILAQNPNFNPAQSQEFKINYTRMGEPMLNLAAVREAIETINQRFPNTHHYLSTIGIEGMDTSWIKGNVTLQLSLHSLDAARRNELIPYKRKLSISELGQVRTQSALKTTLNMTLVSDADFNINELKKHFDPQAFFIKLSPINPNEISEKNALGNGVVRLANFI